MYASSCHLQKEIIINESCFRGGAMTIACCFGGYGILHEKPYVYSFVVDA